MKLDGDHTCTLVPEKSEPERAPAESSEPASQPARVWKVGDFCRTVYSEDSQEYEGKIIAVGEDGGYKYYTVQVTVQTFFQSD